MKTMLSSKRQEYGKRISIFLIAVALIAGMVGCGPSPVEYDLAISSAEGGEVTTPGEGTFSYPAGTVVDLIAEAEEGYYFVKWTGDVSFIADVHAAETTILMQGFAAIEVEFDPGHSAYVSSTLGGEVTKPGEGTFIYATGTVVDLDAEPFEGYVFEYWSGDVETIADINIATTNMTMYDNYSIKAVFNFTSTSMVDAGYWHTLGLKSDGTVEANGLNDDGQCDVGGWDLN